MDYAFFSTKLPPSPFFTQRPQRTTHPLPKRGFRANKVGNQLNVLIQNHMAQTSKG